MTEEQKRKKLDVILIKLSDIQNDIDVIPDNETELDSLITKVYYDIQDIKENIKFG